MKRPSLAYFKRLLTLDNNDLKKLLNQEAHDSYIIPYFTPGYFMENGLTDYKGPRYRYTNDLPRGTDKFIRDTVEYPLAFNDYAPILPQKCNIKGTSISLVGHVVEINPDTGEVMTIDETPCSFGLLKYNNIISKVEKILSKDNRLILLCHLHCFGQVTLEYFINSGRLYCEAAITSQEAKWSANKICWNDCVYLEHSKSEESQVIRTVGGISQPTQLEYFHSLDILKFKHLDSLICFRHGGNIFFRQTEKTVQNRLWCYDEFCNRFWWSVDLHL